MKKVSAVIFMSVIAFFIITANSAVIGKEFQYRSDVYGWPEPFLTVTYEKAKITNINLQWEHVFFNFGLILLVIGTIRLMFWMMRIKRKPRLTEAEIAAQKVLEKKFRIEENLN